MTTLREPEPHQPRANNATLQAARASIFAGILRDIAIVAAAVAYVVDQL